MKLLHMLFLLVSLGTGFRVPAREKVLLFRAGTEEHGRMTYEVYNNHGKKILTKPVSWVFANLWNWVFIRGSAGEPYAVFNADGKPMGIDSIENYCTVFLNDRLIALQRKGKWGFYNKEGKRVIDHRFEEVSSFYGSYARVRTKDGIFFIDTTGKRVDDPPDAKQDPHSPIYSFERLYSAEGLRNFVNRKYTVFTEDGKKGLRNSEGRVTIPAAYEGLYNLNDEFEMLVVKQYGRYGIVTVSGKIVLPVIYDELYPMDSL